MDDEDWRPIASAPKDGREVEVRDDRGLVWTDSYVMMRAGGSDGWPVNVVEWRPLHNAPPSAA